MCCLWCSGILEQVPAVKRYFPRPARTPIEIDACRVKALYITGLVGVHYACLCTVSSRGGSSERDQGTHKSMRVLMELSLFVMGITHWFLIGVGCWRWSQCPFSVCRVCV